MKRAIFQTRQWALKTPERGWWSVVLALCLVMPFTNCGGGAAEAPVKQSVEHWPVYSPQPAWQSIVSQAIATYVSRGYSYKDNLQDYTTSGDYLNFGATEKWTEGGRVKFDSDGVPMIKYGDTYYYNPVTVGEYTLAMYGKYLRHELPDTVAFMHGLDRLLLMEDASGGMPYPFEWNYYLSDQPFEPGWHSSMAQGLALSAFARAYDLTADPKYLDAGDRAFRFLQTSVASGGVADTMAGLDPSLWRHPIYEEYVVDPPSYTLNGFMFTLLGAYDWSQVPGLQSAQAATAFDQGVDTLEHILHYYDLNGFTAYDMSHVNRGREPHIGVHYHAVHVYLLHALGSITQSKTLAQYESLWASYVPK